MSGSARLDSRWIAANPAPVHGEATTKNTRGRVLVIGGSTSVPGAVRLTGEAALRAGAGKVQMATIAAATIALGVAVPEAAVIGLAVAADGEIGGDADARLDTAIAGTDVVVLGPGIGTPEAAGGLIERVAAAAEDDALLILDAAAITAMRERGAALARFAGRMIVTPHHGEMASLTGLTVEAVAADPSALAARVAQAHGAIVVLKARETVIATPQGASLHYGGGGIGMATAGSGDVLAGAIAGILARGADMLVAAGWGVWLHGQAGRRVATERGPVGFLARELPDEFPRLLPQ